MQISLPDVVDVVQEVRQESEDSVMTPLTPSILDLSQAQIQLVHSKQILSQQSAAVRGDTRSRRDAIYLQGLQPEYNSATHTLVFHDPQALTLVTL